MKPEPYVRKMDDRATKEIIRGKMDKWEKENCSKCKYWEPKKTPPCQFPQRKGFPPCLKNVDMGKEAP